MSLPVIERARRYIAKCPPAISGEGGHGATYHVAAVLVNGFDLSEGDALTLMQGWNASCSPPWVEADLIHKIKSARAATHASPRGHLLGESSGKWSIRRPSQAKPMALPPPRPKPEFKPGELKRIAAKTSEIKNVLRFISERSPVRVETQDSASVLRRLYVRKSGEKVIIFTDMKSQGQVIWEADRSDVIRDMHLPTGSDGVWFLPQPVDGEFHPNPRLGGKLSRRSEESVTSWRYAVLESDEADTDDWLRCLVQLPLRIASICESGRRSIQALVRVDAESKADWDARIRAIKPVLVTLSADEAALSAVRLSRLPHAMRGQRKQRLLFLNPESNGVPILDLPTQKVLYGVNWSAEDTDGK